MLIRFKKVRDGVVLTCIREGGSPAVQRTGHGGFFALHDLMHYAVETTMGWRKAFLGLMAEGWAFETFGDREDPRYKAMPAETLWAEHLVAILSRKYSERAWEDEDLLPVFTEDVNSELSAALGDRVFHVERAHIAAVYRLFTELGKRWADVPMGEHLELVFPPGGSD